LLKMAILSNLEPSSLGLSDEEDLSC
jgi:hypothetical protein